MRRAPLTLCLVCLLCLWPSSGPAQAVDGPAAAGPMVLAVPQRVGMGQPFLARLTSDLPLESVTVRWQDRECRPAVSVWNGRFVALAMLGTDVLQARPGPQELTVVAVAAGQRRVVRRTIHIEAVDYPRQDLTLPPAMVTPPAEVLERIAAEGKQTAAVKNLVTPERRWRLPFLRPVPGPVTSRYGLRRFLNGVAKNPHRGQDLRTPVGGEVRAAATGVAALTGDHYYAGRSVYLDHGNGVITMYFHLETILVAEGQAVERGQVIGLSGMSGRATGPHLHFSVSVLGRLVDPEPLFENDVDNLLQ